MLYRDLVPLCGIVGILSVGTHWHRSVETCYTEIE